jgi:large subunit ribosomal protein L3
MNGILGRKIGMTRLFEESGRVIPVTVIEAGPCRVVQVHDTPGGSKAVQLGFGTRKPKRVTKALAGHVQRAGLEAAPAVMRSIDLPVGVEASAGGPAAHGSTRYRKPGSMGAGTDPSRVIKGKRLPGRMGAVRQTQMGLSVAKVDADRNLLYVRGSVPGSIKGIVLVRKQEGRSRYA